MYDRTTLERFRKILLTERARIDEAIRNLSEQSLGVSQKELLGEDSMYDQHPADIATEVFLREKDLGSKDALETDRAKVEGALRRIEEGTYGTCRRCGKPIPQERLLAMPTAELCVPCQRAVEVVPRSRRPVEEYVIKPGLPDEGQGGEEKPGGEPPLT